MHALLLSSSVGSVYLCKTHKGRYGLALTLCLGLFQASYLMEKQADNDAMKAIGKKALAKAIDDFT